MRRARCSIHCETQRAATMKTATVTVSFRTESTDTRTWPRVMPARSRAASTSGSQPSRCRATASQTTVLTIPSMARSVGLGL